MNEQKNQAKSREAKRASLFIRCLQRDRFI